MIWQISWYSDIGDRIINEDRVETEDLGNRACVVLADGVGGQGGGSTAATVVTKRMAEVFQERKELFEGGDGKALKEAMEDVNSLVVVMQGGHSRAQATCVTLWLEKEEDGSCKVVWGHVGDSRLYMFLEGKLVHVTQDHSVRALWESRGETPPPGIGRSAIWQAMGEPEGVEAEISPVMTLKEQEAAFLLCSDGLWEGLTSEEMEETLAMCESPGDWLARLRGSLRAVCGKKRDNNSAAAVFIY
ncbi:MAG: protein phosphatase 2C domain-containing protein [Clostridiales bacterium]|nr:protein phosphatase 2C domain-containing protein [Clostridiales bacterium]